MNMIAEPLADSISVAAARLGISRSTAYILIREQKLEALKVRGRTIISRAAQERFIASLSQAA